MSIKLSGIIIAEAFFGIKLNEKYYSLLRAEVIGVIAESSQKRTLSE